MKIKKTTKPISNLEVFNERDMLYDIKENLKQLLTLYFNFLTDVTSQKNFAKIEEIAYELIEDYRKMNDIIFEQGWLEFETIPEQIVVRLIHQLKKSRKEIEEKY